MTYKAGDLVTVSIAPGSSWDRRYGNRPLTVMSYDPQYKAIQILYPDSDIHGVKFFTVNLNCITPYKMNLEQAISMLKDAF